MGNNESRHIARDEIPMTITPCPYVLMVQRSRSHTNRHSTFVSSSPASPTVELASGSEDDIGNGSVHLQDSNSFSYSSERGDDPRISSNGQRNILQEHVNQPLPGRFKLEQMRKQNAGNDQILEKAVKGPHLRQEEHPTTIRYDDVSVPCAGAATLLVHHTSIQGDLDSQENVNNASSLTEDRVRTQQSGTLFDNMDENNIQKLHHNVGRQLSPRNSPAMSVGNKPLQPHCKHQEHEFGRNISGAEYNCHKSTFPAQNVGPESALEKSTTNSGSFQNENKNCVFKHQDGKILDQSQITNNSHKDCDAGVQDTKYFGSDVQNCTLHGSDFPSRTDNGTGYFTIQDSSDTGTFSITLELDSVKSDFELSGCCQSPRSGRDIFSSLRDSGSLTQECQNTECKNSLPREEIHSEGHQNSRISSESCTHEVGNVDTSLCQHSKRRMTCDVSSCKFSKTSQLPFNSDSETSVKYFSHEEGGTGQFDPNISEGWTFVDPDLLTNSLLKKEINEPSRDSLYCEPPPDSFNSCQRNRSSPVLNNNSRDSEYSNSYGISLEQSAPLCDQANQTNCNNHTSKPMFGSSAEEHSRNIYFSQLKAQGDINKMDTGEFNTELVQLEQPEGQYHLCQGNQTKAFKCNNGTSKPMFGSSAEKCSRHIYMSQLKAQADIHGMDTGEFKPEFVQSEQPEGQCLLSLSPYSYDQDHEDSDQTVPKSVQLLKTNKPPVSASQKAPREDLDEHNLHDSTDPGAVGGIGVLPDSARNNHRKMPMGPRDDQRQVVEQGRGNNRRLDPDDILSIFDNGPHGKRYYAAYLCMSKDDFFSFGRAFHSQLEEWGFRIFLPQRDLVLTGIEFENMSRVVEERCNGKIIVVLSKNYSSSEECLFLTYFARTLDPDARKRNIIPVMIDRDIGTTPNVLKGLSIIRYNHDVRFGWLKTKIIDAISA